MDIRPIETEADYDWALAEVERYFDDEPAVGTAEAARFSVLSALIGAYEDKRWPIEAPSALDAIKGAMELSGRTQAQLAELLGSRSRASEVLSRKRDLTMDQAWKLHTAWGIPAAVLIRPAAKAA